MKPLPVPGYLIERFPLTSFATAFIDPEDNRETFLEMNTRLTDFVYETPFTMSGKAHAESVSDQYKRKTVLTVGKFFPYMIKRLPVIRKRDIIITPIENAVENIEKRNQQITNEVSRSPINPKTLQQVLQGSVRLRTLQPTPLIPSLGPSLRRSSLSTSIA